MYKSDRVDIACQNEFLGKVDTKITHDEKETLEANISESELHNALKKLKDKKSPGFNGLTK